MSMDRFDARLHVASQAIVTPSAALVLPGGRVALVIERARWALPSAGTVEGAGAFAGGPRGRGGFRAGRRTARRPCTSGIGWSSSRRS